VIREYAVYYTSYQDSWHAVESLVQQIQSVVWYFIFQISYLVLHFWYTFNMPLMNHSDHSHSELSSFHADEWFDNDESLEYHILASGSAYCYYPDIGWNITQHRMNQLVGACKQYFPWLSTIWPVYLQPLWFAFHEKCRSTNIILNLSPNNQNHQYNCSRTNTIFPISDNSNTWNNSHFSEIIYLGTWVSCKWHT